MLERGIRSIVCMAVLIAGVITACAQEEHPFIRSFTATVLDGHIQLHWVMQGGSTCDGSDVERSIDGLEFKSIHRIQGICGDAQSDVPFTFVDRDPPELSTLHYRIRLGFDGVSSVRTLVFDQLTSTEHHFHPSPMRDEATLLLNVPASANVEILIFDASGRSVHHLPEAIGRKHRIHLPHLRSGIYTYMAISGGRRFVGRFIKEE